MPDTPSKPKTGSHLPNCLPQFIHIKRFLDPSRDYIPTAKLLPGEYYVTRENENLVTVLGSCIACCIYDLDAGVGGMNHFMLPHLNKDGSPPNWDMSHPDAETRFGNYAMEKLINDIMKNGGSRHRLKFKLFGGGNVLNNSVSIGERNAEFAEHFIESEGFSIESGDTRLSYPRKIIFNPMTGKVRVKRLKKLKNDTLSRREKAYEKNVVVDFGKSDHNTNEVELF